MGTIAEGKAAPAFSLPAGDGSKVSLKDLRGKWVVLYFYPKDNTPGCTTEACSFRDNIKRLEEAGAVVLGVSRDSVASHQKFAQKFELPFPLLSDEDEEVCRKFDVIKEKTMCGKTSIGIERSTFVIDPAGKIKKIFRKVKVNGHTDEVLQAIAE